MTPSINIRQMYDREATIFLNYESIRMLRAGTLSHDHLRAFISNVIRTHYNSPHILAFLFSSLPSHSSELLRDNLLDELGLTNGGPSHPSLLVDLARGAGFTECEVSELVGESQDRIRHFCSMPLPYPTMRDVILSVLLETEAFEYLLSRYASPLGTALHERYGLSRQTVRWFDLHSEADIRHAEEGFRVIADYLAFYRVDEKEFETIRLATFQPNVFLKRYIPEATGTRHTSQHE